MKKIIFHKISALCFRCTQKNPFLNISIVNQIWIETTLFREKKNGTKRNSVRSRINRKSVISIQIWFHTTILNFVYSNEICKRICERVWKSVNGLWPVDWKKPHRLSERLVPLGIVGTPQTLRYHSVVMFEGFQEGP